MTLEEIQTAIQHHGEMQNRAGELAIKQGRLADAARCAQRAEAALNEGLLLHGDQETRDPEYAMGNQKLYNAAYAHGLLSSDHTEPTIV